MVFFFLGINILVSSCNNMDSDNTHLCKEFYKLNEGKIFDRLFDVSIGNGRVTSIYDPKSNKYDLYFKTIGVFNSDTKEYINLPVFDKKATLSGMDSAFKCCNQKTKDFLSNKLQVNSESDLFNAYVGYVNLVLKQYYEIETPDGYSSNNIIIDGNPILGEFITFKLNEKCKCYYLESPHSLNQYWSDYFKKLNKLDSKWYYEIVKN